MGTVGYQSPPCVREADREVSVAVSCRDADHLPKVENAGAVLHRDGRSIIVMHNGVLLEEPREPSGSTTKIIKALRGHLEPQKEAAFAELLTLVGDSKASREPLIIEFGRSSAYYSLWLLKEFPAGRAVYLDSDPLRIDEARRNFTLNSRTPVFIGNVVTDEPAKAFASTSVADPDASDPQQDLTPTPQSAVHRLVGIGGGPVDVLVLDINGAEVDFLGSWLANLRACLVRYAIISTHHHSISGSALTHQQTVEMIEAAGGVLLAELSVSESFSGKGLVVASFIESDPQQPIRVSRARASQSLHGGLERDLQGCWEKAAEADDLRALLIDEQSKVELLSVQLQNARFRRQQAEGELKQSRSELAERIAELGAIRASKSWKLTKPVRRVAKRRP
ncbi:MAG: hypothetical protein WCP28_05815 [Actinomycetes bacterium]